MVQILPKEPSLAEMLGMGLGGGIQTGLQAAIDKNKAMNQPMSEYQQLQTILRQKELEQKERFQEEKREEWEYSQNKDFKKELTENYRDTLEADMRLNRMSELNKTGKLAGPVAASLLEKLGIPIAVLGNPDSEEFDKLSKDMLKNIRTYFGARINVVEVENFLKTIPSLMNSEEGREKVINNLKMLSEPRKLMFEEYRQMKKESSETGTPMPVDLEETIIERIKPRLDELAERFAGQPLDTVRAGMIRPPTQSTDMSANKDEQMVNIIDPSGKKRLIPKSMLKEALKAGAKLK